MTRAHLYVLAAVLVTFLAVPRIAVAYEPPPCPADQPPPTLSVSDPKGAGSLFATHVLRAKIEGGEVRSFTAPGARIFSQDDAGRPELVSDTPGPLTATAVVVIRDTERLPYQDDYSCTKHGGDHGQPASSGGLGLRQLQASALHRPVPQALQPLARLLVHGQAGEGRRRPLPLYRPRQTLEPPQGAGRRRQAGLPRLLPARVRARRALGRWMRAALLTGHEPRLPQARRGWGRAARTPGPAASRSRSPPRRDSTSSPAATSASSPRPTGWTSRCSSPATALPACGSRPAATRSVSRPPAGSRRSTRSADRRATGDEVPPPAARPMVERPRRPRHPCSTS